MLIDPRLQPFIGLPYGEAGRGGDAGWDCWGLVLAVYREVLGIELPRYEGKTVEDEREVETSLVQDRIDQDWITVAERAGVSGETRYAMRPAVFDVAYFSLLRRPHVAIIASPTGLFILHTHAPSEIATGGLFPSSYVTRFDQTPWKQTLTGIYRHPEVRQ